MDKIAIIGSSGSGKSWLAGELGLHYNLPVVELDTVVLDDNFEKLPDATSQQLVQEHVSQDQWIIEGVYPKVADTVWGSADAVVWLNLPFGIIRERYEQRDLSRGREGPFPDVNIHKKEYTRLSKLYPELLDEHEIEKVVEVTNPDYAVKDIVSRLEQAISE